MSGVIFFLVVFAVIGILDAFAQTLGVDSRPDFLDERAPASGIYS